MIPLERVAYQTDLVKTKPDYITTWIKVITKVSKSIFYPAGSNIPPLQKVLAVLLASKKVNVMKS